MSRPSTARSNGPTVMPVTTMTNEDGEVQCPICKTMRYMNHDLVFFINPECYHPLCNNCVHRLFENGPNQCPYVGCHKTLRKKGFREPTFSDLNVEREVDIRKRVAAVFNNTEDDFEDLKAYNDYLDMVETLTMDLVYGTEAERQAASQKLLAWEDAHRADIERNRRHGERLREQTRRQVQAEQKAARERRAEAQRVEEEDRQRKAQQREEDLDMLASAPAGQASKIMLKKRGQHRKEALAESEAAAMRRAATVASGGLSIKGLKKKTAGGGGGGGADGAGADEDRGPYDPFGKLDLSPSRYSLKTTYRNDFLESVRHMTESAAGGYNVQEYYSRALFEAYAGMGVFVGDEKETGRIGMDFREVATIEAEMAAAGAHESSGEERRVNSMGRSRAVSAKVVRAVGGGGTAARGSDALRLAAAANSSRGGSSPHTTTGGGDDSDGDVHMKDAAMPDAEVVKMDVDDL